MRADNVAVGMLALAALATAAAGFAGAATDSGTIFVVGVLVAVACVVVCMAVGIMYPNGSDHVTFGPGGRL